MSTPVSLIGDPAASVRLFGRNDSTANLTKIILYEFSIRVSLRVESPQGSTLHDWEVGIIQTCSGPIDTHCYKRATSHQVFVSRLIRLPGAFYPDRIGTSPVFYDAASAKDLSIFHPGQAIELRMEDFPSLITPSFLITITGIPADQDVPLFRNYRRGFFYTYIVVRHKSTGQLYPLYIVRWWFFSKYVFSWPGQGIPLRAMDDGHKCELIDKHPFVAGNDPAPVVSGHTMSEVKNSRQRGWTTNCPDFSQHV